MGSDSNVGELDVQLALKGSLIFVESAMQVSVSAEELGKAPAEVQAWFLGRMGFGAKTDPVVKRGELKPAKVESEEPKPTEETTTEVLLQKAVDFVEAKGQASLVAILKRMGIPNVKGCPPEKRAALFAEMATHG